MTTQICFVDSDGYMVCNAIRRGGKLITNPNGKWYKFLPRKKAKNSPKEDESNA